MEETSKKIGFFKRIKISIFNLECYKTFTQEKFSKALKYLFILTVIVTLVLSIVSTFHISKQVNKLITYIKQDFSDFELADGKLTVNDKVNAFDEEYQAKLIADTSDNLSDEQIKEYEEDTLDSVYSIILLKDKCIYSIDGLKYESSYKNIATTIRN